MVLPAVSYGQRGEEMILPLPQVRAKAGVLKAHHCNITFWLESPIFVAPSFIRILAREI